MQRSLLSAGASQSNLLKGPPLQRFKGTVSTVDNTYTPTLVPLRGTTDSAWMHQLVSPAGWTRLADTDRAERKRVRANARMRSMANQIGGEAAVTSVGSWDNKERYRVDVR